MTALEAVPDAPGPEVSVNIAATGRRTQQHVERLVHIATETLLDSEIDGLEPRDRTGLEESFTSLAHIIRSAQEALDALKWAPYDVVKEYVAARRGHAFTIDDLQSHLRDEGIAAPQEPTVFQEYLGEWLDEIVDDEAAGGRESIVVKTDETDNEPATFALVSAVTPRKAALALVPSAVTSSDRQETATPLRPARQDQSAGYQKPAARRIATPQKTGPTAATPAPRAPREAPARVVSLEQHTRHTVAAPVAPVPAPRTEKPAAHLPRVESILAAKANDDPLAHLVTPRNVSIIQKLIVGKAEVKAVKAAIKDLIGLSTDETDALCTRLKAGGILLKDSEGGTSYYYERPELMPQKKASSQPAVANQGEAPREQRASLFVDNQRAQNIAAMVLQMYDPESMLPQPKSIATLVGEINRLYHSMRLEPAEVRPVVQELVRLQYLKDNQRTASKERRSGGRETRYMVEPATDQVKQVIRNTAGWKRLMEKLSAGQVFSAR